MSRADLIFASISVQQYSSGQWGTVFRPHHIFNSFSTHCSESHPLYVIQLAYDALPCSSAVLIVYHITWRCCRAICSGKSVGDDLIYRSRPPIINRRNRICFVNEREENEKY
jgi:hypothetical protein